MMRTRYELYDRLGVNGERRFWCFLAVVATSNCAFPNVAASSMLMIIISDSARETLVAGVAVVAAF